jgi:hypothetical protein
VLKHAVLEHHERGRRAPFAIARAARHSRTLRGSGPRFRYWMARECLTNRSSKPFSANRRWVSRRVSEGP